MSKTPHKHAALIKAWADGATIQWKKIGDDEWLDCPNPSWWVDGSLYRIKPEPKPDRVETRWLAYNTEGKFMWGKETPNPNVKYTFDGETGKLKAVELIN